MSGTQSPSLVHRLASLRDRLHAGMDRREFLRTLVTGGYALGASRLLGVDDFLAADDGEVPVVTALVRNAPNDPWSLEERVRHVPAEWYASVKKALEVNELLARYGFTGYLGSVVVPGDYASGTATVSVGISADAKSLRETIDQLSGDVPVSVETIVESGEIHDGLEPLEPRIISSVVDDRVPSGVACETTTSLATLGPALYHPDGRRQFFVTAAHAFDGNAELGRRQLFLPVQDADSLELGTVAHIHPGEDVVAIEPRQQVDPAPAIDAPTTTRIRGQYTRWGLADLIARGKELEKVGALTGHTRGRIQGIDAITCFTDDFCRHGQIRWGGEMDLTDGDSGSVSYHPDPDGEDGDVLVAGFNNARTWWPGQSYIWGVAAYRLTEMHGYHF
ncbi:hypothetical protein [Halosolutus gelatinilyticus]|uniref:hypothetical protein n=1 Tax=Halosolutus gelatinilyticus TaxID=2931975 RepID=UPI001FF4EB8D|nr:hypothetical protein [Halosolutus gelatinilyticus]